MVQIGKKLAAHAQWNALSKQTTAAKTPDPNEGKSKQSDTRLHKDTIVSLVIHAHIHYAHGVPVPWTGMHNNELFCFTY